VFTRKVPTSSVLRERGDGRIARVTNMELFFDLVYVFAIIQLSTQLYDDPSWNGALETLVMFLAVWWVWNYTAWATGWIDPESRPGVALMAVLMVLSLVMASSIPHAFDSRGLTFACAYVAMQLLRAGYMVWAFGPEHTMGRNYAQLGAWSAIAGVIWIAGALVHDHDTRLGIWAAAAAVDLAAPAHGYWLPGVRPTPMTDWTLSGGHLAERCQLLLMIAFGESILRLGESFAEGKEGLQVVIAFILGFLLTFALWGIYFLHHAQRGAERMETETEDAARLGRGAYAYAHAVMVAAVIVIAVGIHMAIEHPSEHVEVNFGLICLGGPALFLAGITASKRWLGHGGVLPGAVGVIALALFGGLASLTHRIDQLAVAAVIAVALSFWALLDKQTEAEPESAQ
jgi:low temperature requirement protein LtrA